jgi:flagellar biosynthesis/type III secretory pathway chaperone
MATKDRNVRALAKILDLQIEVARQMEEVLRAEHRAIVYGDAEALLAAVSRKLDLVSRMKEAEEGRTDWLRVHGLEGSVLSDLVRIFPDEGRVLTEKGQLLQGNLERLALQSRANGQLLREHLRVVRDTIQFLQGLVQLGFQYGQQGKLAANPGTGGRLVDREA